MRARNTSASNDARVCLARDLLAVAEHPLKRADHGSALRNRTMSNSFPEKHEPVREPPSEPKPIQDPDPKEPPRREPPDPTPPDEVPPQPPAEKPPVGEPPPERSQLKP